MSLKKSSQIRYHKMCLEHSLPTEYTSMDLSRMALAYFNITSLGLLDALPSDKETLINSIYTLQHPLGGFRSATVTALPETSKEMPCIWDPANIPATYFALCMLVILGDDLSRVDREGCLRGLKEHQTVTGGFAELMWGPERERGNTDLRFVLCAVSVWYILRGGAESLDVEGVVRFVKGCKTFDHGYSKFGGMEEGHDSIDERDGTIRWLLERQTEDLGDNDDEEQDLAPGPTEGTSYNPTKAEAAGFAGRRGKRPDTCYSFWVGGSATVLGVLDLIDTDLDNRFLERTQHIIGGFTKLPFMKIPDLLHSFTGLAALALGGRRCEDILPIDAALCIPRRDRQMMEEGGVVWWRPS